MKNNIFFLIFFTILSLASADESIDTLLDDIKHKTDLSKKTKIANSGISFIYTRDDIYRMQARYLKDILKSSHISKYAENRFGIADPLTIGTNALPFQSSNIRIYIDNQEVSAGMYGSGLIIYGDLDIGFVDHIEIYTQSPTYEYATESTMVLIKLYSKSSAKDKGGKLETSIGSYGANTISAYYSEDINNDWSYFTYISQNNDNRQKHYSHNIPLSRDKDVSHLFTSFANDNQKILIDITDQQRDAFMSISRDATPKDSRINIKSMHLGYDIELNDFSFLLAYDYSDASSYFTDDVSPIISFKFKGLTPISSQETKTKSEVYTSEIKYSYNTLSNKLTTGLKYRYKAYNRKEFTLNNYPIKRWKHNVQTVLTGFLENKYLIQDSQILTFGLQFSNIKNNHSLQENELFMYRFGYTYLYNNFSFKTIISHNESILEPYLIGAENIYTTPGVKKSTEYNYITQDLILEQKDIKYEFIMSYIQIRNALIQPSINERLLDNYNKNLYLTLALFRCTYKYNRYDKLFASFDYKDTKNLYNYGNIKDYTAVIRNINTYKNFDLYNEVLFTRNNKVGENFYDLNLGVRYHYNKDLSISVKGENILNKARSTTFSRLNPQTLKPETPISISPIDKKFTFSLEYLF